MQQPRKPFGKRSKPFKKGYVVSKKEVKKDKTATKTLKNSNKLGSVEAKWYKARNCYRVWVPARLSEKGKECRRFFETKEQAEKFIFETKRNGSVELAELAVEEKHVLGVIRQSQKYEPKLLLEAWQRFEKEEIGDDRNLTVQPMARKLFEEQLCHVCANISEFWRRGESDGRCRINREAVLCPDPGAWCWQEMV